MPRTLRISFGAGWLAWLVLVAALLVERLWPRSVFFALAAGAVVAALIALPVALALLWRGLHGASARIDHLERRQSRLARAHTAGQRLRRHDSPEAILQAVAEAARDLTGASSAAAYLRDDGETPMLERIALASDHRPDITPEVPATTTAPARLPTLAPGDGLKDLCVKGAGRTILAPLEADDAGVCGLIWLDGVPASLDGVGLDALTHLTDMAAAALYSARTYRRVLDQVSSDMLTGLLNRRPFEERLGEEVARAARNNGRLAMMIVDLDNFGEINAVHGHEAGDAVLTAVAVALDTCLRVTDVAARYNGDTFAILLPDTTLDGALAVAERVRAGIVDVIVPDDSASSHLAASIGVAALPDNATTAEDLLDASEQAMRRIKQSKGEGIGRIDSTLPFTQSVVDVPVTELEQANLVTVEALAAAVDAKDPYTRGHSQRVSLYAATVARVLGLDDADVARIRLAGLLHDVGKIGIPDAVLTKPGALTRDEVAIFRTHSEIGERMISAVPFLRTILPAVRHHHERWDGKGYPDGLAGAAIPLDAAILMVADSFDAMTSSRPYRPALPLSEAQRRLHEGSGTQFDPRIVAAMERALDDGTIAPIPARGTMKLSPERIARAS